MKNNVILDNFEIITYIMYRQIDGKVNVIETIRQELAYKLVNTLTDKF